jgi:hypothetical protein
MARDPLAPNRWRDSRMIVHRRVNESIKRKDRKRRILLILLGIYSGLRENQMPPLFN